jgi:pimeloyl-ACP methyl ester carboxylesterase
MPSFERDGVHIHYETYGDGYPLLTFAPGGMRSSIDFWERAPFNPTREFANEYRVIALDQRNTGGSTAPITAQDGWHSYTADHIALLDHLEIERCHVHGSCIGGPFCFGVMQAAPERVSAAVLQQSIGLHGGNRHVFHAMFDNWVDELKPTRPEVSDADWRAFRDGMYGGDFVFNVSRDFVRSCEIPMLVLMGNDIYHPQETSREIASLAPNAELIERWKEPEHVPATIERIRAFLRAHT